MYLAANFCNKNYKKSVPIQYIYLSVYGVHFKSKSIRLAIISTKCPHLPFRFYHHQVELNWHKSFLVHGGKSSGHAVVNFGTKN